MSATIIAVANQKGGTGKTTTCENLGIGLVREGKHVLLVDTDPQASLTIALGYPRPDDLPVTLTDLMTNVIQERPVNPEEAILSHAEDVDLIPASIMLSGLEVSLVNAMSRETVLKQVLESVKSQYDYILLDCMPSIGMLTINALAAADQVLIPVQANYLSAKGLEQLVPSAKNKNLLTDIPHRNIEDMALAYRFDMGHNERTSYSILVTNKMLNAYGISAAQLHDDALEAASHSCPATLRNMNEVIHNIAGQTDPSPMWVASIENGQNGACVIQYPHFLDDAAETLGGSFYVLPSSIHEVLLLADDTSPSLSELENMVRTINQAEVAPEERLSDNVFHYDCESHIFENARTFEARQSAMEQSLVNAELFEAAKPDTMTVLLVQPNAYPRVVQIGTALEDLQHAVDGDIEAVYPFEDSVGVICNEEGKLRGLPANRALRDEDGHIYDVIAGSFLVVGLGEEDFCSLSAEQIDKFEALFHQPEAFVKMGHSITAVPIPDSVLQARDEHRDAPKLTHSSHDDR